MEIIGEYQKNSRDLIRISLGDFKGRPICDIRIHYKAKSGEWLPTQKGITFATAFLPEILSALKAAEEQIKGQDQRFQPGVI